MRNHWDESTASDYRRASVNQMPGLRVPWGKVLAWLVLCGVMAWALLDAMPGS